MTDIKIPYMDGMEPAIVISEESIGDEDRTFTGFDEFEYARKRSSGSGGIYFKAGLIL